LRRSLPAHPPGRELAAGPGAAAPGLGGRAAEPGADGLDRQRLGGAGARRGPRGSIPANLAKALLRAPGLERIAKSPRALLETLTTPVTYDARNADDLLVQLGVPACPPLESYVEKLVEYVKEHVRRRRETKV